MLRAFATRPFSRPAGVWTPTSNGSSLPGIVVAVDVDAAWPPTEGCYLNNAESEALYEDAGNRLP